MHDESNRFDVPRITIRVDDEHDEWLQEEADRLGISKAKAGGRCIELIHDDSGCIEMHRTDAPAVQERLDELEQRVEDLESDDVVDEPIQEANREPHSELNREAHTDGVDDRLDEVLQNWEPSTEVDSDVAREETRRAVELLRREGKRMTRSEFQEELSAESHLGERSWWDRAVQPGLRELVDEDVVEYRPGYHDYKYKT